MPIPDGVYDIAFGPVAILLAVIHDVLALGLVSKRVRRAIPPITELTIGSKFFLYFESGNPNSPRRQPPGNVEVPRLHWYSSFERAAEPENTLAVVYTEPLDGMGEPRYLDAHAVIRRMPPALAAGITYLSIDCSLAPSVRQLHQPVMHSYNPGTPAALKLLNHALRQHGAVFTALRGLEIWHTAKGYTLQDEVSEVVLGLCARALVTNTRLTLRHLALKTAIRFSDEDFLKCLFAELEFLNADLTPFIALPFSDNPEADNARYRARHDAWHETRRCTRRYVRKRPRDLWPQRPTRRPIGKISAKCCSFSAVSAPMFASKYAFISI